MGLSILSPGWDKTAPLQLVSHWIETDTPWLKYQLVWPLPWPGKPPRLPLWPNRPPPCLWLPDNSLPPPLTANPRLHSVKSLQSWRKESWELLQLQTWRRLAVYSLLETVSPVCTV